MVEAGDKVVIFGYNGPYPQAVPVTTPDVGDRVMIVPVDDIGELCIPMLTFTIGDKVWIGPDFKFAGFNWKLDVNLQLIPLAIPPWADDGIAPYLDYSKYTGLSYGGGANQFVSISGDGHSSAEVSTYWIINPPQGWAWWWVTYPIQTATRTARYMNFTISMSAGYDPGGASYIELYGKKISDNTGVAVNIVEPIAGMHQLDLGYLCKSLSLFTFIKLDCNAASSPVSLSITDVVFSS
jgi:hypothetical protein